MGINLQSQSSLYSFGSSASTASQPLTLASLHDFATLTVQLILAGSVCRSATAPHVHAVVRDVARDGTKLRFYVPFRFDKNNEFLMLAAYFVTIHS